MTSRLTPKHALLALAIVFVWGTNFVVIRLGLNALPPLFFATLRFTFVFFPLCLLLPRPAVRWRHLAAYGLGTGLMQFGLLFIAMKGMISPGLASLVVQTQAFFTVGLAVWRTAGERLMAHHLAAAVLALAGMGLIALHSGQGATVPGLLLVVGAALGWAISNQTAREASTEATAEGRSLNMLAFVVWSALFSVPPLLVLALISEGPAAILAGIHQATPVTWGAVAWQSVGNTMFGYTCWAWLLARYPAATVAPLSLLVPVFGFAASALLLGEPIQPWKLGAGALILTGLAINTLWGKRGTQAKRDEAAQAQALMGEPD